MNKFDAINKVLTSDLKPEDKCLLVELIVRADGDWVSWPSVERLCKVRGIKHEKNFKGADFYLPGLVTKSKRGRKNVYTVDIKAVEALSDGAVIIKHTPSLHTPAVEGAYTPAVADNTPAVEGANTTSNTSLDSTQSEGIELEGEGVDSSILLNNEVPGPSNVSVRIPAKSVADMNWFEYQTWKESQPKKEELQLSEW